MLTVSCEWGVAEHLPLASLFNDNTTGPRTLLAAGGGTVAAAVAAPNSSHPRTAVKEALLAPSRRCPPRGARSSWPALRARGFLCPATATGALEERTGTSKSESPRSMSAGLLQVLVWSPQARGRGSGQAALRACGACAAPGTPRRCAGCRTNRAMGLALAVLAMHGRCRGGAVLRAVCRPTNSA